MIYYSFLYDALNTHINSNYLHRPDAKIQIYAQCLSFCICEGSTGLKPSWLYNDTHDNRPPPPPHGWFRATKADHEVTRERGKSEEGTCMACMTSYA
jgi:hypothetical protein